VPPAIEDSRHAMGADQREPVSPDIERAMWEDITIRVLSDDAVQVKIKGRMSPPKNYVEMGFEDRRRTQKPILAWRTLLVLAQEGGVIRCPPAGRDWRNVEKEVQELRKRLRAHFGIAGDPVPFVPGIGYRAVFVIERLLGLDE